MKLCTKGNHLMPDSEFYTKGLQKDGNPLIQSWCKGCINEHKKAQRRARGLKRPGRQVKHVPDGYETARLTREIYGGHHENNST